MQKNSKITNAAKSFNRMFMSKKRIRKEDLIEERHETFRFVLTFYICFDLEYAFENIYSAK